MSSFAKWATVTQTICGASHVRNQLPNQDAIEDFISEDGSSCIIAVSDGHGGESHFRSNDGSSLAVRTTIDILKQILEKHSVGIPDSNLKVLPDQIVGVWKKSVLQHRMEIPYHTREMTIASSISNEMAPYGATLIAVAATPSYFLFLQLGDGDILCVNQDGNTYRPFPKDDHLFGDVTTSLSQPDAQNFMRIHLVDAEAFLPSMILISTDGYSNSFRSEEDFKKIGPDFLTFIKEAGAKKVSESLAGILHEASEKGSGDDITLGIMIHAEVSEPSVGWKDALQKFRQNLVKLMLTDVRQLGK